MRNMSKLIEWKKTGFPFLRSTLNYQHPFTPYEQKSQNDNNFFLCPSLSGLPSKKIRLHYSNLIEHRIQVVQRRRIRLIWLQLMIISSLLLVFIQLVIRGKRAFPLRLIQLLIQRLAFRHTFPLFHRSSLAQKRRHVHGVFLGSGGQVVGPGLVKHRVGELAVDVAVGEGPLLGARLGVDLECVSEVGFAFFAAVLRLDVDVLVAGFLVDGQFNVAL